MHGEALRGHAPSVSPLMGFWSPHQSVIQFSNANFWACGTARPSPVLPAHPVGQEPDELAWETLDATLLSRLPAPFPPASDRAIQDCRYSCTPVHVSCTGRMLDG